MTPQQFSLSLPLRITTHSEHPELADIHEANGRHVFTCDSYDAAEIVRAVNCHNDLLAACKAGLADIERLYCGQEQSALYGNAAFKALKKAIANAEREEQI